MASYRSSTRRSLAADANGGQENADAVKAELESIDRARVARWRSTDVDLDDYAAVFYPGGHGPMEDLAVDPTSGELLTAPWRPGKPLGVVCHAPAALLATEQAEAGRRRSPATA